MTNLGPVAGQLMSTDESKLAKWFVDNYIRRCSQLPAINTSRLFDDVSTTTKLEKAVSAITNSRINNTLLETWITFTRASLIIGVFSHMWLFNARTCASWIAELANVDSHLSLFFTGVAFLHVAHKSSVCGLNDEFTDILATFFGHCISERRYFNYSSSQLSLHKAVSLMKIVANKALSTMSLIAIELSKAYLYTALCCEYVDINSVYCLANVYLAVLYCTTGQYQTAMDHCTLVMRSQDHSQCSSHVVQGDILPKIDDDIDNVLGLAVFYQHVRGAALKQEHETQHAVVFTTNLLAHFLSVTMCHQCTQTSEYKMYKSCIIYVPQLFIVDVLLFVSFRQMLNRKLYHKTSGKRSFQPMTDSIKSHSPELVELLQKSAVEHLTALRYLQTPYFGSVAAVVTTDFEALYAYKHGDYQRCLQLSTQNVHTLLYARPGSGNVLMVPEFLQLMDDDIVSLNALTRIINPEFRHGYLFISQLTLSLYLMTQCQLKLHYSVPSLAQTLNCTKVAHSRKILCHKCMTEHEFPLERLVLQMTARKALMYMSSC